MAFVTRNLVKRNAYFDSVALMRIAAVLNSRSEVTGASLMMGTPANRKILEDADLLTLEGAGAGPNDVIIAVSADESVIDALLAEAEAGLDGPARSSVDTVDTVRPRTLQQAVGANLALISTPGLYAAAEALKALKLGMHVFLFSDNVSLDEELMLKAEADRRGLLVMGPDCGTAIINGIQLGFANAVRRGNVGLIGASGTGSQEISCLIDRAGAGISQLIGVGSRDLSESIGARSMLFAFDALDEDPETQVIVLVSKPPAPVIAARVLDRAERSDKKVVINFMGSQLETRARNIYPARTLEDAASLAASLSLGRALGGTRTISKESPPAASRIGPGRTAIRALFSGGTFAYEAKLLLGDVSTSVGRPVAGHKIEFPPGHLVLDLGDDEFTIGRPHPMIDPTLRVDFVRAAAAAPDTAVVLLDVVLGTGSAPDPARALVPAIREAGDGVVVIAFVCGTRADKQGLDSQEQALREAGAVLAPSSTAATRLAAEMLAVPRATA